MASSQRTNPAERRADDSGFLAEVDDGPLARPNSLGSQRSDDAFARTSRRPQKRIDLPGARGDFRHTTMTSGRGARERATPELPARAVRSATTAHDSWCAAAASAWHRAMLARAST